MSWLSKLVKKIINVITGGGGSSSVAQPVPAPTVPAGPGSLKPDIRRVVQDAFEERNSGEIDASRSQISLPLPSKLFCDGIADAYEKYFRTLHAGIMSPSPIGLSALKTGLRVFDFLTWGNAFAVYWQSTVWTPTGVYTGGITTNAIVIGAALQSEINLLIFTERPRDMMTFADRIATILTTYTTQLLVQATLSVPPNTKVEKVM